MGAKSFRCRWGWPILLVLLCGGLIGCQSTYYNALEQLGIPKRELLASRVEAGRDAQQAAEEQFVSALERFQAVVSVPESELSRTYAALEAEYEESEDAAQRVHQRIDAIESVAEALFEEWEDELDLYQSERYRRLSAQQLRNTRERYESMLAAMQDAADSMPPVLLTMRDNVLFLKHNLNARAIGALQGEVAQMEDDVARLRARMRDAIARSDAFIAELATHDGG
ncbi:DUF2959 domain-containing protein [Halomonas sp. WWR20]